MQILYFVANLIYVVIVVLQFAMLARAILSWFVMMNEGGAGSGIYGFLTLITEPVVWPFRKLFDHFGWGEDMPIDMPFLAAVITLSLLGTPFMTIML